VSVVLEALDLARLQEVERSFLKGDSFQALDLVSGVPDLDRIAAV
jgi:hypothetical protein